MDFAFVNFGMHHHFQLMATGQLALIKVATSFQNTIMFPRKL